MLFDNDRLPMERTRTTCGKHKADLFPCEFHYPNHLQNLLNVFIVDLCATTCWCEVRNTPLIPSMRNYRQLCSIHFWYHSNSIPRWFLPTSCGQQSVQHNHWRKLVLFFTMNVVFAFKHSFNSTQEPTLPNQEFPPTQASISSPGPSACIKTSAVRTSILDPSGNFDLS